MDYTSLEGEKGIEVLRGDITKDEYVLQAVEGVNAVIHLAALLPPASERDRVLTFSVNVEGTSRIAEVLKREDPDAPLVLSSSVSTYGDTTRGEPPVGVNHPQHALDVYADSKIIAERRLREDFPNAVVLRISGISVPAFQEPPETWPFMAQQRIEFIHRDDVVTALCASVTAEDARGCVFNVAGGPTWRVTGSSYVKDYYDILGVPIEEARFQEDPGWFDWYDTDESQRILGYQNTSYETYLSQLRAEIERLMEG
jgi:nucleoside-diphosphate-sugar epimerase